jgi:hypothetical protein
MCEHGHEKRLGTAAATEPILEAPFVAQQPDPGPLAPLVEVVATQPAPKADDADRIAHD